MSQDSLPVSLASNVTEENSTRKARHLLLAVQNPATVIRAAWAGGEGYACITSRGILGSCRSFRDCYPFFKVPPPGVRYPVLNAWDTWVLGNQDTCNYFTDDGREAHGVCCTNPIQSTPIETDGSEQNKVEPPVQNNFQGFGGWPPPIPTHPPDHAAPTHPPSLFDNFPSTTKNPLFDFTSTTKRTTTTWATKPPISAVWPGNPANPPVFAPLPTTSKRPTFVVPTESPIINEVTFDGGSCGARNAFLDQERIVGGQNADPNEWPWVAVMFNGGRQFCGGSLIDNKHVRLFQRQ